MALSGLNDHGIYSGGDYNANQKRIDTNIEMEIIDDSIDKFEQRLDYDNDKSNFNLDFDWVKKIENDIRRSTFS